QVAQNTVLRLWIELTESVSYTYGKVKLTWFEEIFEEYKIFR
ncbi:chlorohydrolase, partial [Streptococcus pneumoniae 1542]